MKIPEVLAKNVTVFLFSVFVVLMAIVPFSCRSSVEGIQFLEGDYSSPKITGFSVKGTSSLELVCSEPVKVSKCCVKATDDENAEISCVTSVVGEHILMVTLEGSTVIGKDYVLEGLMEDEAGNSLSFSIPFKGFNDRLPVVVLSELRKSASLKTNRTEFIELYCLTGGNLSGLEVCSASEGDKWSYSFGNIEVKEGEYITLHLRKTPELIAAGAADELEQDLTLSRTAESYKFARDLWCGTEKSCLGADDIIMLKDCASGRIYDALLYGRADCKWTEKFSSAISLVEESGVWQNCEGESDASFDSAFLLYKDFTVNRSLSRQNIGELSELLKKNPDFIKEGNCFENKNSCWMLTAKRSAKKSSGTKADPGVTPGYANSSSRCE